MAVATSVRDKMLEAAALAAVKMTSQSRSATASDRPDHSVVGGGHLALIGFKVSWPKGAQNIRQTNLLAQFGNPALGLSEPCGH